MKTRKILLILSIITAFTIPVSAQNIFNAVDKGELEKVKELLKKNPELANSKNQNESTPLHLAAKNGHIEIVRLLISRKVEIDAKDNDGWTPLWWAARYGHEDIVNVLIKNKAKVGVKDKYKRTPLHWAAKEGHGEIVSLLIKNGANVNAKDFSNWTPMFWAAGTGHKSVVEVLVANEANLTIKDEWGKTPLHWAASDATEDLVKILIENGAEINGKDNLRGRIPLHYAVEGGNIDVSKILIANGSEINVKDKQGKNMLFIAVENGSFELVNIFLLKGANLHEKEVLYGRNVMHVAAIHGYKKMVDIFIKKGININVKDKAEKTPLYYAAKYGHQELAGLLIKGGAEKSDDIEENYGYSRFLKSELKEKEAIIWYLGQCGWGIKTKNYFLIFEYIEYGEKPAESLLANGHINPDEIKNQNVYVFVSHEDEAHYDPVIFEWEKTVRNITYIFGWQIKNDPKYIHIQSKEKLKFGDLEIIGSNLTGTHSMSFLVKADGLVIYHPNDGSSINYIDVNYLGENTNVFDIVFLPLFGGQEEVIETLQPNVMFPMHEAGNEYNYKQFAMKVAYKNLKTKIICADNRGDKFYYRNRKIE